MIDAFDIFSRRLGLLTRVFASQKVIDFINGFGTKKKQPGRRLPDGTIEAPTRITVNPIISRLLRMAEKGFSNHSSNTIEFIKDNVCAIIILEPGVRLWGYYEADKTRFIILEGRPKKRFTYSSAMDDAVNRVIDLRKAGVRLR